MKKTAKKIIITLALACILICGMSFAASAESGSSSENTNVFSAAFEEIKSHSAEILSALAFAGSAVLTFTYKRGIMPTLKHGIGTVGNVVSDIKGTQDKLRDTQEKLRTEFEERLKAIESFIKNAEQAFKKSEQEFKNLNTGALEREKLTALVSEQVSLLYDVFMFSSIPEYQKDAVGHRVEAMRKLLAEGEVAADAKENKN